MLARRKCHPNNMALPETSLTYAGSRCYDTWQIAKDAARQTSRAERMGKLDMEETRQSRVENDLGRDDIRQLVRRIAVPSMLAQL